MKIVVVAIDHVKRRLTFYFLEDPGRDGIDGADGADGVSGADGAPG